MTDNSYVTALVLAGSRTRRNPVAESDGKPRKAFVDIDGIPMIDHVLKTLEQIKEIDKILVCLPPSEATQGHAPYLHKLIQNNTAECFEPEPGPSASVLKAFTLKPSDHDLLVTTADHPLLTPEIIDTFMTGISDDRAGMSIALAPLSVIRKKYPEMKRTGLRFRDGSYSGCNLFYLKGGQARKAIEYWQRLEQYRKQPWKMALAINPLALIGYLLRLMTLGQVLTALEKRCGTPLMPVIMPQPEATIDVDSLKDLEFVRGYIARNNK